MMLRANPLCILLLASFWSEIEGSQGTATASRDRADNDEASNIENFIALVPDQPSDEMRSNEISINPIATLVLSEYPTQGNRDYRNISMKSTPGKTPKSLTSQEVEDKWSASGTGWRSLAKQRYHTKTKHHSRKHRHHHRVHKNKSRPQGRIDYFAGSQNRNDPLYGRSDMRRDKWSNLVHLQSQLQREEDDLPPYMKKINRRTKQLRVLMEGTATVPPRRHRVPTLRFTQPLWLEENIFEEQYPNKQSRSSSKKSSGRKNQKIGLRNSLPGEESAETAETQVVLKSATRAGNFIYHRVPSAKPSTGATFGRVVRKQGLPFVAITDRRAKIHP